MNALAVEGESRHLEMLLCQALYSFFSLSVQKACEVDILNS